MEFQTITSPKTNRTIKTSIHSRRWSRKCIINFEQRKEPPKRSYSAKFLLEIRTPSRRSDVQSNYQSRLEEVDFSSTIPDLKYKRQENNSPDMSPTHSQMMSSDELAKLMVMIEIFENDKEYLRNEAKSENTQRQN